MEEKTVLSTVTVVISALMGFFVVVIALVIFYRLFRGHFKARRRGNGFTDFGTLHLGDKRKCHLTSGTESDDDEGFAGEGSSPDVCWGDDARRRFDGILADAQWANDAAGLVPLCIDLLRSTQSLLEYLMELAREKSPGKNWKLIVETADDINPLVDAVVQSMYPPLDSFVLVAQATELVRSARSLAALVVGGGGSVTSTAAAVVVDGRVVDANSEADVDGGRGAGSSSLLPGSSSSVGLSRRRYRQVDKLVAGAERSLQALKYAAPAAASHCRMEREASV